MTELMSTSALEDVTTHLWLRDSRFAAPHLPSRRIDPLQQVTVFVPDDAGALLLCRQNDSHCMVSHNSDSLAATSSSAECSWHVQMPDMGGPGKV